ncbi:MAG: hypothetical protein JXB49_20235 [Bacteroidales bacterium]|nr:hypothetical protein [Bacteroidales bacterium]
MKTIKHILLLSLLSISVLVSALSLRSAKILEQSYNYKKEIDNVYLQKVQNKEFIEIEIGTCKLKPNAFLTDINGDSIIINELRLTSAISFSFNYVSCFNCNAEYIENELKRIMNLSKRHKEVSFYIISNFDDFRKFKAHAMKFVGYDKIHCFNVTEDLLTNNLQISDPFYFIIGNDQSLRSVFVPDKFEENNIKYFEIVFNNYFN